MSLGKPVLTGLARLFGVDLFDLARERDELDFDDVVERFDPDADELTERAADRVDDDRDQEDSALERFAEQLGRDPDDVFWKPVETIERLPNRATDTYIWILRDGVDAAGFADQIDSMYRDRFDRAPRGLHVPVETVEEIRLADPGELRTYVEPHLSRAEDHEEHVDALEDNDLAEYSIASAQGGD